MRRTIAVASLVASSRVAAMSSSAAAAAAPPSLPIMAPDAIMLPRAHGTCVGPVQAKLRWGADRTTADHICCFNRHYAESAGYWEETPLLRSMMDSSPNATTFCDSVTGKPLFIAPVGRTLKEFIDESRAHGWPSFRDEEVVWENVRVVGTAAQGETVSVDGTHLGHNLPDYNGNRYCINLVSVAGEPSESCASKL